MRSFLVLLSIVLAVATMGCGSQQASAPVPAPGPVAPPAVAPPVVAPPGIAPPGVTPPGVAPPGVGQASTAPTGTPATRAALIGSLFDDQTFAVLRVDLANVNAEALLTYATAPEASVSLNEDEKKLVQKNIDNVKSLQNEIREVYVVFSLNDLPVFPPYAAIHLQPGADPKLVYAKLTGMRDGFIPLPPGQSPTSDPVGDFDKYCFVKDSLLVVGTEKAINRVKTPATSTVENLEQAFQLAGDTQVQLLFVPTESARTQLGRLVPDLPPAVGFDGPRLLNSIRYASASLSAPPGFELKLNVQSSDAGTAQQLQALVGAVFDRARQLPNSTAQSQALLNALTPRVDNDRLSISLSASDPVYKDFEKSLVEGAAASREAARRMQFINNMKQVGLAMHNYAASQGGRFPALKSGNGNLSWRVHLLPHLEEAALYQQFNLDEPWDSPTNKPLIEKMPKVFANPNVTLAPGMTTMLASVGESAAFPPTGPLSYADMKDGTSNTLLVVEVNADKAVTWTKPDDWEMDVGNPLLGLGGNWKQGIFHALLCDGSVHALNMTIEGEQMRRLVARNDGQLVDWARLNQIKQDAVSSPIPTFGLGNSTPMPMPPDGPIGVPLDPMNPQIPGPEGEALDESYIAEAKRAFAAGNDAQAMQYLYAEALAGEDKDKLRESLRWAAALKRPTLAIRWGIGIQYTAPRTYAGPPTPIGRVQQGGAPQPQNNAGQGGDPNAPQPGADPTVVLDYFTAELGTKLLDGLKIRVDQGQFGDVLKAYAGQTNPVAAIQNDPTGAAAKALAGKPIAIVPGVVFVGMERGGAAGQKELVGRAKDEQLDALVLFDINVSPTRTVVGNNTKIMLYDLTKGEALHASKLLKNTAVEVARKEGKGADPVDDVMERFLAAVDANFKLEDFPENLNETNVTARVQKLADAPPANKLATLLEIAFWQSRGLLTPENATVAYEKILGPDGARLAADDLTQRKAVIDKLLPKPTKAGGEGKRIGIGAP